MSAELVDASISTLTITGMKQIHSIATLPQEITQDTCPVLFPNPQGWLGEQSTMPQEFDTEVLVRREHNFTLSYILAYAPVGSGRGLNEFYPGIAAMTLELQTKIYKLQLTGLTAVRKIAISKFGMLQDAVGKMFYGCSVDITCYQVFTTKV